MAVIASPRPAASARARPIWLVLLAAATIAGIGMGVRQVMGLYQIPVTELLNVGRETFSTTIGIANIVWGIAAPFTGGISDRFGAAWMVVFGAICTALGFYLLYAAKSDAHLYLSGVFAGLGVAGAGINSMVGAVGRAVPAEKRTSAIATLGMGSGIGVLLALPYTHLLIGTLGWQTSLLVLASTAMVMLPLALIFTGSAAAAPAGARDQTLREALREAFAHPSFWLLVAGFFVCGFHVVFYGTHLPAYVKDKGFASDIAVTSLFVVGAGNLVGTYLAGQSARFVEKRIGLALIYFGRALIFLAFLFLPVTGTTVIVLSGLLGLLWLSTVPLTSSLVGTFFGPTWMAMLYGIAFLSHQLGSFLGVWMAGRLFDMTKSYDAMWWISVGLGVFAGVVHLPIKERPVARLMPKPQAA